MNEGNANYAPPLFPPPGPYYNLRPVKGIGSTRFGNICKIHDLSIEGLIFRGGMSEVYLAKAPTGAKVVIKRARGYKTDEEKNNPFSNSHSVCQMLMRKEVEFLKTIPQHPCIVRFFNSVDEDNEVFIVEELVDGPTLSQYVKDNGALDVWEASRAALQILDTITFIHERADYAYRDLQPNNILVSGGRIVFVDFGGVAKVGSTAQHLSMAGYHLAKDRINDYENGEGSRVGEWLDTFSFANTYYFMLTGLNPPKDEDTNKCLRAMEREMKKRDVAPMMIEAIGRARNLKMTAPIQFHRVIRAFTEGEGDDLCGACSNPIESDAKKCDFCESVRCHNCDKWLAGHHKYCGKCGFRKCDSCGETSPADSKWCIFCGEPMSFDWE